QVRSHTCLANTPHAAHAVDPAYDFATVSKTFEFGGGNVTLISTILSSAPKLLGIVLDSSSGSAEASDHLRTRGVLERCEVIAGDFFRSVPGGGDAYILKSIIHDWDDERSATILKNCRDAISAAGKLLLIERVMPARIHASA